MTEMIEPMPARIDQVLTEIKNRGTGDVCIVVCDGLTGLPESITTVAAGPGAGLCAAT